MSNRFYMQGMQELRRSNASGTHKDRRNKRARTRGASQARAIKEQS